MQTDMCTKKEESLPNDVMFRIQREGFFLVLHTQMSLCSDRQNKMGTKTQVLHGNEHSEVVDYMQDIGTVATQCSIEQLF